MLQTGLPETQELQAWLVQEWSGQVAQVIASMTGQAPETRHQPVLLSTGSSAADQLWWHETFSVSSEAVFSVGAGRRSWEEIGKRVLAAAGVDDPSSENAKTTWQEVLNQSLSGLAQALRSRFRKELVCDGEVSGTPPEDIISGFSVALTFPDCELSLYVAIAPSFIGNLENPETPEGKAAFVKEKTARDPEPLSLTAEPYLGSIDLLLDVELPVSVSFGRAHLPLKEVIKLTTGSIVELNRTVSEPVEVIVNNCVIARGQVVVVEGNFGIRIEQVISRQERLRTLK